MKKVFIILISSILCLLFTTLGVSASSDVDNEKYLPKVITTDNGYKMMFDSELARIARKMSSDSYDITSDSNPEDIATTYKEEGFVDIQQSHSSDDAILDIYSNNFLVGVKTFEVDGEEKHVLAITFRGTDLDDKGIEGTVTDLLFTDASVIGVNGYHSGFYGAALNAFDTLFDMKFKSLNNMTFSEFWANSGIVGSNYSILVTGHSLGGAVANIFTGDLLSPVAKNNVMCYTFASPIVCSPTKAKEYDAYNIFNIINTNDAIPKLGYNIFSGVRLGNDLKVTVTDSEESAHNLKVTYEKATNQVIDNIDSLYSYIHCVNATKVNEVGNIEREIHIHTKCSLEEKQFFGNYGNSNLIICGNVTINTPMNIYIPYVNMEVGSKLNIGPGVNITVGELNTNSTYLNTSTYLNIDGNLTVNSNVPITGDTTMSIGGNFKVDGNLTHQGTITLNNGYMEIGGNYTRNANGPGLYGGTYSNLNMTNEDDYILIKGDYSETSHALETLTAGTIEIKGNLTNYAYYNKPEGTHRTILSGDKSQTISVESGAKFNILEITNTSGEGITIADLRGDRFYNVHIYKEVYSTGSIINNSRKILLREKAKPRNNVWDYDIGLENWNGDESIVFGKNVYIYGTVTLNKENMIKGNVDVYYPLEKIYLTVNAKQFISGDVEIGTTSTLTLNADLVTSGDFIQLGTVKLNGNRLDIGGNYKRSNNTSNLIMDNNDDYICVNGNYSETSDAIETLTAGTMEIKGNLVYEAYYDKPEGTHKTILSGNKGQTLSTWSDINFNILEIANTSESGITFSKNVYVSGNIKQPVGTKLINSNKVMLQGKSAFVDYGTAVNTAVNKYMRNHESVIPTWLDYQEYSVNQEIVGTTGLKLSDVSVVNNGNEVSGTVKITNNDKDYENVQMIVAIYSGKELVGLSCAEIDSSKGTQEIQNYAVYCWKSITQATLKVMLWEDLKTVVPLCKSLQTNITQ